MATSAGLIGVANTLQNRVGNSLGAVQLLTPELSTSATLQAGATSIGTMVLNSIKEGQDRILESTNRVVELLSTQVDIQEEAIRREREKQAELDKEKNLIDIGASTIPINEGPDAGKVKLNQDGFFGNLDVGDIAALATAGGLLMKNVAKKVIKGGAKGGFYGILASFLAKPAIDFLEDGILKIDIPEEQEKKMEDSIIAAAVGLGLAGLPGALIGLGAVGVNSLIKYINGEQESLGLMDAVSLFAGGVGVSLLSAKAVTALTAAGWVKSAGILGAITATPVLVAVGVAIALGVAVNELVKFNESVQAQTLAELEEITKISRDELSKRFAQQKESFLENIGSAGLANLLGFDISDLSAARIGTEQALDEFKKDPKEFDTTEQKSVLKSLDGIMLASSEDLETILNDGSKTKAVLDTLNAARQLAVAGAFGEKRSKELLAKLLRFSSNLQVESKKVVEKAKGEGTYAPSITTNLSEGKGDLLELFQKTFIGAQDTIKENTKLIDITDKAIKKLEARDEEFGLTREEDEKLTRLIFDRNRLAQEILVAKVDMKDFSTFGLFGESGLGFDAGKLQSIFSDEELSMMIKGALKNELFKFVTQGIIDGENVKGDLNTNVQTDIKSNNQSIKQGDMIVTPPSHTVDSHLQK